MTHQEAKNMARWLYDNGRTNVVICQRYPSGPASADACYVKCMTPGMQDRVYSTIEEVQADSMFWGATA